MLVKRSLVITSFAVQRHKTPCVVPSNPSSYTRHRPKSLILPPHVVPMRTRSAVAMADRRSDGTSGDLESPRARSPGAKPTTTTAPSSEDYRKGRKTPGKASPKQHIQLRLGSWTGPEVPLRPELVAISLVYLVQGLLGLSRLAVFTFFKDDLALDPAAVGLLTGLGLAPWLVKPV